MHYSFATGRAATKQAGWAASRIEGCANGWDECVTLLVHTDMKIMGVVVFHDYNPHTETMCLSAAGEPGWLTRTTIQKTHEYLFSHCQLAVWQCGEKNAEINKLAKGLGYTPHTIPRLHGRDEAQIIWTLSDDEWHQSRFNRR